MTPRNSEVTGYLITRAIFLIFVMSSITGQPVDRTRGQVVVLEGQKEVTGDEVGVVEKIPGGEEEDPGKVADKRTVGKARHWLLTNEDAAHVENGTFVGVRYDHTQTVPWGVNKREESISLLPRIELPGLPKVEHIEDPPFMKAIKDFLGG